MSSIKYLGLVTHFPTNTTLLYYKQDRINLVRTTQGEPWPSGYTETELARDMAKYNKDFLYVTDRLEILKTIMTWELLK